MTFRKSICASILVGGACTAMSLAANAAIYVGSFDPLWGVSVNGPVSGTGYSNIGYEGTATFYVPDACLNQAVKIFKYSQDSYLLCDTADPMKLLGATVNFYQNTPASQVGTLHFGPVTYGAGDAFGVYIAPDPAHGGAMGIAGLNALIGPATMTDLLSILRGDTFFLQFGLFGFRRFEGSDAGETFSSDSGNPDDGGAYSESDDWRNNPSVWQHATMYLSTGNCASSGSCVPDTAKASAQSAPITITAIPEPQALLLALSALVAAASVRRRH